MLRSLARGIRHDEEFLDRAGAYIFDESIFAAKAVACDGVAVAKACADHSGARPKVVNALLGRLKRAVVKDGRVTSALDHVDPFVETAVYDPDDLEVVPAFAIYRTLERLSGVALLIERRTPVQWFDSERSTSDHPPRADEENRPWPGFCSGR